jgi:protein SCO1
MMRSILIGILVVMAAGVGYMTFDWYRQASSGEAYGAPFTLVDHTGAEITEKALRGHPSAVFFGFTHCPEVCPTTLFEMDGWLNTLGDEGKDIRAFFVSPEPLESYVANVSDRIPGITGDPEAIAEMARSFGIYSRKVELEGGDYTMDHTASILLLDRNGAFSGTIAYGENPDTAVAKLKRLAGA